MPKLLKNIIAVCLCAEVAMRKRRSLSKSKHGKEASDTSKTGTDSGLCVRRSTGRLRERGASRGARARQGSRVNGRDGSAVRAGGHSSCAGRSNGRGRADDRRGRSFSSSRVQQRQNALDVGRHRSIPAWGVSGSQRRAHLGRVGRWRGNGVVAHIGGQCSRENHQDRLRLLRATSLLLVARLQGLRGCGVACCVPDGRLGTHAHSHGGHSGEKCELHLV